jgi:uncharacterized protein
MPWLDSNPRLPIVTNPSAEPRGLKLRMRFKINEIGDDGLALDVPITSEWLAVACPDLDARLVGRGLALRGRLSRSGEEYLLTAQLRGSLEAACGRCLEPARIDIDAPLVLTYVPADEDDEELADDADVVGFAGNEIDLSDEVRDEFLLAIPLKPLCSEACRGLCPVCGGNRNAVPCTCEADNRQAVSKFAALGKLKI